MSNNASIREIFDDISLSVINFLENHEGVASVDFVERRGITLAEITAWEQDNAPYSLPNDYKAFLLISNGLLLRWHIRHHDSEFPLGCLHLNKLASVQPIARNDEDSDDEVEEQFLLDTHNSSNNTITENEINHFDNIRINKSEHHNHHTPSRKIKRGPRSLIRRTLKRLPRESAAFDIDNTCTGGTVAFFYSSKDNFDNPQVWFQDMSCKWFFIANTFTDYFRLMIMHLGLPCWQYAFTEVGLDPVSQQWFRFLSPERLAIDIDNCKMQKVHKIQAHSLKTAVHPLKKQQITTLVENIQGSQNADYNDRNSLRNSTRNPSKSNVNSNRTRRNKGRLENASHNAQTNMGRYNKNSSQNLGSGSSRGSNQSYSNAGRDRLKRPQSAPSNRRYNGNGSTRGKKLFG